MVGRAGFEPASSALQAEAITRFANDPAAGAEALACPGKLVACLVRHAGFDPAKSKVKASTPRQQKMPR